MTESNRTVSCWKTLIIFLIRWWSDTVSSILKFNECHKKQLNETWTPWLWYRRCVWIMWLEHYLDLSFVQLSFDCLSYVSICAPHRTIAHFTYWLMVPVFKWSFLHCFVLKIYHFFTITLVSSNLAYTNTHTHSLTHTQFVHNKTQSFIKSASLICTTHT